MICCCPLIVKFLQLNCCAKFSQCMLLDGGFNLTRFSSNSHQILENLNLNSSNLSCENMPNNYLHENSKTNRALGVIWSTTDDRFEFAVKTANTNPLTKRFHFENLGSNIRPPWTRFTSPNTCKKAVLGNLSTKTGLGRSSSK